MKLKYNGIKALLARKEMTQVDLAERMGIHRNTVASWLNGQRSANVEDIIAMLEAMGYSVSDVLDMRIGDLMRLEEEE